jgi:hypothetical protein
MGPCHEYGSGRGKEMSILGSKDGTLSIFRLVILDAAIISLLGWLIEDNVLTLRLTTLIAYPALFILNVVLIWKAYRGHKLPKKTKKLLKRTWFVALVSTAVAVVAIIYWIRSPDVRSTVQAIVGITLAGWAWFLVMDLRRPKRED